MDINRANQGVPRAIEGLDLAQALENVCGNSELLRTILITFYKFHRRDLDKIRHCHTEGDIDSLHRIAHALKGLSGTLAAEALHTSSQALDTHIRSRDLDKLPGLIDRVEADLAPTLTSIKKTLIDDVDQACYGYH
jgi:HPt (histidine-containing phosphotransfer) domain-containing protein